MDGKLLHAAEQLRKQLQLLDPHDRDSLVWLHGYLTGLLQELDSRLPDLMTSQTLLETLKSRLDSMLQSKDFGDRFDEPFSESVPANLKPGPKGLRGGAIVPLPDSELPS